ncbi:hypothetical protein A2130_01405 [Candidatus Woesebacteria bacterium GWC2_33_12]|uniref:Cell division FtsK/SpoIIIE n=1 Tax=Candidatus Woesebacteria bacterium GW2011_GWB1_33_22 TaxID=1618566 RepID=A0A0G0BZA3_9BACT|nr:MAG: cell division FtsK/SpoIIIE [Candidatus Woesebacteria bacterium GW2011_GWC2_33_12]KKP41781.1 MAG: cell division FtsK/SpoIIIE [Candidatus Woesebacteria bacterium GW2011_GWA2_33_20]KKP44235.1 MAG: cell division FtsK/SpoIIIE [Candidatus Woesebacteria bacterium GW2011_GWB1_33_22]KKP45941.1 MAG: cell division FtsK/SpoIIIE [Microgenomates group bacterium GW2011_GWC1_33_28]KKP49826.1 MAG: cell division FtsK/SpoIIIE [Candidatus Woesebacteria bacterium GW2011_GWA1_33_33]OGM07411.1 MAG: hypotheti
MITEKIINKASKMAADYDRISASYFQRTMSLPYVEAVKLLNELEARGVVGPANGAYPREVIKKKQKIVFEIKLVPGLIMALIFGSILSLIYILIFSK